MSIVQHDLFGDTSLELMVARWKYDTATGKRTLYWPDRNSQFHRYEDLAPGAVRSLLAEVDLSADASSWSGETLCEFVDPSRSPVAVPDLAEFVPNTRRGPSPAGFSTSPTRAEGVDPVNRRSAVKVQIHSW